MSYTCNITFVTSHDREGTLLGYLRGTLIPLLFNPESPALNPTIKKVVETGGEKVTAEHGLSIALSAELPSEEDARFWTENILNPALADFGEIFGEQGLFFITLLENIS